MSDLKVTKGYKVTDKNGVCNPSGNKPVLYEVGKTVKVSGALVICTNGIHFCQKVANCFSFYSFDRNNRVFEIEAYGDLVSDDGDIKNAASEIKVIRELSWLEVLDLANTGSGNTGYNNAGNDNAGNDNAGNDNAGNYNAGNRNAGYANAGNDNAGAFNTLAAPYMLFNKPSAWSFADFTASRAFNILSQVNTTLWVNDYQMTSEEKEKFPYYVTTKGYVRNIPFKEAFQNLWHNLNQTARDEFKKLPNFDSVIFEEITGVKF